MAISFNQTVSLGDLIQTVGIGFALTTFYFQNKAQLTAQRHEVYQRLEIESNEVFKFEAEYREFILPYKSLIAPLEFCTSAGRGEREMLARKYYETTCNLFEVSARLRRADIVPNEVFGSWVAWFFDTLCEWGFRAAWDDLRDNYTAELRAIFDEFVVRLIKEWDSKAADAKNSGKSFQVSEAEIEVVRRDFYRHVGGYFRCRVIKRWLDQSGGGLGVAHPCAFR